MKTVLVVVIIITIALFGCNFVNEKKKNAATSFTENLIERATGKEIGLMDVNHADKNSANIQLDIGGREVGAQLTGGMSTVTAAKDGIAFAISKDNNGQVHSIILGITGPLTQTDKPFKASSDAADGALKCSFQMSNHSENSMQSFIATEATAEIISISDKRIIVQIFGKIAAVEDSGDAAMQKNFAGKITLDYPAFNAIGISKNDLIY